jgi:L-fuculose-phosphate aldolase
MTVLRDLDFTPDFDRKTKVSELSARAELALLARALDRLGFAERSLGHMTYRQPDETFLTLPLLYGWGEVRASDVLRIDVDGRVLEGETAVTDSIKLHLALHRIRPSCTVTIHNHPHYATVWSALRRVPPAYDQTSAVADAEEFTVYDDYPGAVNGEDEARVAAESLGDANYALLANHGVMVVADNISQAFHRANALEWRCKQAWLVEAIGGGVPMPVYGQRSLVAQAKAEGEVDTYAWQWAVRQELRADPSVLQ